MLYFFLSCTTTHTRIDSKRMRSGCLPLTFLPNTMERPIISYDDITLPYEPEPPRAAPAHSPSNASQSKKRKWSNQKGGQQHANKSTPVPVATAPPQDEEDEEAENAESRYLSSEEIWDDSALIDAWNAATEEYEVRAACCSIFFVPTDSLRKGLQRTR